MLTSGIAIFEFGYSKRYKSYTHYNQCNAIINFRGSDETKGESVYDIFIKRLGFENMTAYIKSYPGAFKLRSNIRNACCVLGPEFSGFPSFEVDDDLREVNLSIINYIFKVYVIEEFYKNFKDKVANGEPELIASISIEKFKECCSYDLVDEKDLWFCTDWSDT